MWRGVRVWHSWYVGEKKKKGKKFQVATLRERNPEEENSFGSSSVDAFTWHAVSISTALEGCLRH